MTDIPDTDLHIEAWPPREKGGQHVGITATGVKVVHLPTGTEACVKACRSQHMNKLIAIEMIEAAITHPRFR